MDASVRIVRQYAVNEDWVPLRSDMLEVAIAWGFEVRERINMQHNPSQVPPCPPLKA